MKKHTKSFLIISLFLVLVLSACQINITTQIDKNGSGTYTQEIGFQGDEASMAGMSPGDENFCASQMDSLPPNTAVRQETRNENETWCVYESPFSSLEDLKSIYGMTETQIHTVEMQDGKLLYDITLDLQGDTSSPMGSDMFWKLSLPGKIVDHNADEVDGNTLIWKLRGGELNNIQATSEISGIDLDFGGNDTMLYIIAGLIGIFLCCLVPIIIGVIIFILIRRKKTKSSIPTNATLSNEKVTGNE